MMRVASIVPAAHKKFARNLSAVVRGQSFDG